MEEVTVCLLDSISTAGLDNQQLLYMPQISGESKVKFHNKYTVVDDFFKKIPELAYFEICNFYDENKEVFESIEKIHGYNIWLYHHERLYNESRKLLLKKLFIEDLVNNGFSISKVYVNNLVEQSFFKNEFSEDLPCVLANEPRKSDKSMATKLSVFLVILGNSLRYKYYRLFSRINKKKTSALIFHNKNTFRNGKDAFYGEILHDFNQFHFSEPPSFSMDKESLKISVSEMKEMKVSYISDVYFFRELLNVLRLYKLKKTLGRLKKEYQNLPLETCYLAQHVRKMHSSLLIYELVSRSFSRFLKKHDYKSILMIDENSPTKRAVRIAAKLYGVKTIAYQHGLLGYFKPSYDFSSQKLKDFQLSDMTLVWGERDKIFLHRSGYPDDSIKVVGQIIANLEVSSIQELQTTETNYLFCSQPLPQNQLRKVYLEDVIESFAQNKNEGDSLVLRFHPRENDSKELLEKIDEILKTNVRLDVNASLHKTLSETDVLITPYSAVAKEFALYNRPIITLDYLNNDIIGYSKDGLSLNCIKKNDLISFIQNIKSYKGKVNHEEYTKFNFHLNQDIKKDIHKVIKEVENG